MKDDTEKNLDFKHYKSFLRYGFHIVGKRTTSKNNGNIGSILKNLTKGHIILTMNVELLLLRVQKRN